MNKNSALLLLVIIVFGIYYPAIFAGVNSLDDFRMLDGLPQNGHLDLFSLFNPAYAIGYFRPLTILSYYIDNSVFSFAPEAMHLENVVIHLINALLLFAVGCELFKKQYFKIELSFVAACIFALHPLNVEAVAWISGRTDLLATFFGLLGLLCVCQFINSERLIWLWYAASICTIGALAKETALFCLPSLYLLAFTNDRVLMININTCRWNKLVLRLSSMIIPFILLGVTYVSCRLSTIKIVTKSALPSINVAQKFNFFYSNISLMKHAITTYGFYIKKLIYPLPLNFAITSISPLYLWLGLSIVFCSLYLCIIQRKNSLALQMTIACFCVMFSAVVISRASIAWTPYAERYMYLPTVFFAIGIVDVSRYFFVRFVSEKKSQLATFVILSIMAVITSNRAMVWQNNLTLYQDTIRKSPDFAPISNELAIALSENNQNDKALRQIEIGKKSKIEGDMALLYVNQASILGVQKKYDEAYKALDLTFKKSRIEFAHIEVIKTYIYLMERDHVETKDRRRAVWLMSKLADFHELYYKRSGDTDHLYRAGQLALAGNDRIKAHKFFLEVAEKAPNESMFKSFGRKMARKTEVVER